MKTNKTKVLNIAKAKLKYYRELGYLGGYLTQEEVKVLQKEGYRLRGDFHKYYEQRHAKSKPCWVYFNVHKNTQEK